MSTGDKSRVFAKRPPPHREEASFSKPDIFKGGYSARNKAVSRSLYTLNSLPVRNVVLVEIMWIELLSFLILKG